MERGTATVTFSEDDVVETEYRVVYVKRDGAWLIDRVTEDEIVVAESHYDQLKELEWLIGDWVEESEGVRVEMTVQWTTKQQFMTRIYKVFDENDEVTSSGLQIIGWDAKDKVIRSWLFDSDGGVVTGTWHQRETGWAVPSVATLADGGSGSFTGILKPQEDGSFLWEKINCSVDGKLLPNTEPVIYQPQ